MSDWITARTEAPNKPPMPEEAAREWDRLVPYLLPIDRVTQLDLQALTEYCMLWNQVVVLRQGIEDEGDELSAPGVRCIVEQPLLQPLLKTCDTLMRHCVAFGLTPKSRDLKRTSNNLKPTELKRLMGNPGNRPLGADVVKMTIDWQPGDISTPEALNDRAGQHFTHLRENLTRSNMFTPLDVVPASLVCIAHDLFLTACEQRRELWTDITNKHGEVVESKAHPITTTSAKLSTFGDHLRRHFGMAPKYRAILTNEERIEQKKIPLRFGA